MKEINNDIQEFYCSHEISELLEKKGFDCFTEEMQQDYPFYWTCPHALAKEWIRVNFKIYIEIRYFSYQNAYRALFSFLETGKSTYEPYMFDTPQEAEEAAILYVLKELI